MDHTTFIFRILQKDLAEMLNFGTYYCDSCKVSHTNQYCGFILFHWHEIALFDDNGHVCGHLIS